VASSSVALVRNSRTQVGDPPLDRPLIEATITLTARALKTHIIGSIGNSQNHTPFGVREES
jgi:hypothetical protein